MINMRVTAGAIAAVVIAGLGAAVGTGGEAKAGSNLCPSNRVCIYDHAGFVALLGTKAPGEGLSNVSSGANDKTSSWENKTGTNARWYVDANFGGTCRNMPVFQERSYVGDSQNDDLTSWSASGAFC